MSNADRKRILGAFWHKGRNSFVPLSTNDITNRTGIVPHQSGRILAKMRDDGLVDYQRQYLFGSQKTSVYDLTDKGRAIVVGEIL